MGCEERSTCRVSTVWGMVYLKQFLGKNYTRFVKSKRNKKFLKGQAKIMKNSYNKD